MDKISNLLDLGLDSGGSGREFISGIPLQLICKAALQASNYRETRRRKYTYEVNSFAATERGRKEGKKGRDDIIQARVCACVGEFAHVCVCRSFSLTGLWSFETVIMPLFCNQFLGKVRKCILIMSLGAKNDGVCIPLNVVLNSLHKKFKQIQMFEKSNCIIT